MVVMVTLPNPQSSLFTNKIQTWWIVYHNLIFTGATHNHIWKLYPGSCKNTMLYTLLLCGPKISDNLLN